MSLKDLLMQDLKTAMKDKDLVRKNTVQLVRAAILQEEKDKHIDMTDEHILDVVASQVKKRKAVLPEFENSGRTDLVEELNREIAVLMSYLPEQLTDDELTEIIMQTIQEVGATTIKDMGKVIGAVSAKVKGRSDNKRVSEIVKKQLGS